MDEAECLVLMKQGAMLEHLGQKFSVALNLLKALHSCTTVVLLLLNFSALRCAKACDADALGVCSW